MHEINEECGVFGVYSPAVTDVAKFAYYGLYALQHRGQESCGIVVNDDGIFASHKDIGLVSQVFEEETLAKLPQGKMAVAHARYGTTGKTDRNNCQPIEVNHMKGRMALAHNGNLVNSFELRSELEMQGGIFHTTSDTETIAYVITKERITSRSIQEAINKAMYKLEGAYSLVIMSATKLIAARDPKGFRPLCYGQCADGTYVVASESCALHTVSATFIRDIEPGEIVIFSEKGVRSIKDHCNTKPKSLCVFEYIYFSRPDSTVDGVSIHAARVKAGKFLAKAHPVEADVVIGCPDSGLDAAIGYAKESGIPYGIGFIKNKYIGRTFISPGQEDRMDKVKIKLNTIAETVAGKRVIMVDDSIVRGTTSRQIVTLLKQAGATEVHVRVSAPPFTNPCYYGTDIDSKENLIACKYTVEETCEILGADSLGYLSMEDVVRLGPDELCNTYCTGCFSGEYPTAPPAHSQKNRFEQKLSERGPKKPK